MGNRIQLNFVKYLFSELLFIVIALGLVYWISDGDRSSLLTIGLIICAPPLIRILMLWWKLRDSSFEITNGHVRLNGVACDVTLQRSFLPFDIGSFIKLSYTKGAIQKHNIYLSKGAMNKEEWARMLACRT
ncbi:hypothetical protein [Vibrio splendidus]|uniref:hypothetical protein n=1 Tax=Vibrio splendidus TaxID=29497 RepID=UPI00035DAFBD|nr:hypothetical protein [Vibrio splendidus]MDP2590819.1 hypothetical protein [Vibrio splendidus]OEE54189.1 hypothetical protein A146_13915 [Vibrio splendidus FF-500]